MCKKIFAFLLAFSMMFTMSVPAFAAEKLNVPKADSEYHVMWDNTDMIIVTLNFSGNKAACSAEIYAKSGTNKISATLLLKQVTSNGTKTVKTWTKSSSSDRLYLDKSYYVASGHSYILEVNASVDRNGTVEYVTASDRDSC